MIDTKQQDNTTPMENIPGFNKKEYQKQYRQTNKEKIKQKEAEYYRKNKEKRKAKVKAYQNAYYDKNKSKIRKYYNEYNIKNEDRVKELRKQYREKNKEQIKRYINNYNINYYKQKYKTDALYRVQVKLRASVRNAFKRIGLNKPTNTINLIGCTWLEAKDHFEQLFQPGMTWANHGKWHIDHIIPVASANTIEEIVKLNHISNLQPLWAVDNIRKGAKLSF